MFELHLISKKRRVTYVCHELFTRRPDILCQSCTEHHDLLVVWRGSENFLNITTHV